MSYEIEISKSTLNLLPKLDVSSLAVEAKSKYDILYLLKILAGDDLLNGFDLLSKEKLRVSILKDLTAWLSNREKLETIELDSTNPCNNFKANSLLFFGSIVSIADGALGASTILSLLPNVPGIVVGLVCLFFSVISLAVFYAFDLVQISTNLGIKKRDVKQSLEVMELECEQLKLAIDALCDLVISKSDKVNQETGLQIIESLQSQCDALNGKLNDYRQSNRHLIAKRISSIVTGLLYFSGGYFLVAPSLALLAPLIASIFSISAASVVGLPVVISVGIIFGLTKLALYWFCERPQLEKMVGKVTGFDQDLVESCDNYLSGCSRQLGKLNFNDNKVESGDKSVCLVNNSIFSKVTREIGVQTEESLVNELYPLVA